LREISHLSGEKSIVRQAVAGGQKNEFLFAI